LKGLEKNLFTSKLIFEVWPHVVEGKAYTPFVWYHDFYDITRPNFTGGIQTGWAALESLTWFYYTVHCTAALVLGLMAGWITVWVERRREPEKAPN
jgi:hypothetical protein